MGAAATLDAAALRDYTNWVGATPAEIVEAVKRAHGWANVFPKGVPLWAHRLRNFFNEEPATLTRYDAQFSREFVAGVQEGFKKFGDLQISSPFKSLGVAQDRFSAQVGLSGDVYKDHVNKTWFQMAPGATIYHWGANPKVAVAEAWVQNYVKGQEDIPIFKLISPDGTGGSHETIIWNRLKRSVLGDVNRMVFVGHLVNSDYWHQGSYNYSETANAGLGAHEKRDVAPHKKYPYQEVYFNPPNRFLPLKERRFPKTDERGNLFARMV